MLNSQALRVIESAGNELPLSLDLPTGLPFDDWVSIGRRLCQGQQAINWHIGDWWAFGDHRYGERAKVAAEGIFGREFGTLMNLAAVARAFEPSRRREVVSFTHHVEAASLSPNEADALLDRAERDHLSTRDLRREVQAMKASNDPDVGAISTDSDPAIRAKVISHEVMELCSLVADLAGELQKFRPLLPCEADKIAPVLDKLGEAHAERSPVPQDFVVVFREQGRLECERVYGASRLTVNRWMKMCGEQALKDERAAFVKYHRDAAHRPKQIGQAPPTEVDTYLPVARMAAEHMRISRYGGWVVSQCETGGWRVGTVYRSSEELIAMAERQGFDREAAVAEARQEGY